MAAQTEVQTSRLGHAERGRENIRALCLINSLGGGGAERSLVDLLPYLEAAGIHPVIAHYKDRQEGVRGQAGERFDVRYTPAGGILGWTKAIRGLLRRESFDLIHTTLFDSDLAGRLAAFRTQIPLLTSLVNTSYAKVRVSDPKVSRRNLLIARLIDGWTARHMTTHFHAITHAVKDDAVRMLGISAERVTVVERGRDPAHLGQRTTERRSKARRMLGLLDEEEVLVTVGRQDFQKGQRYLLEAFARIAQERKRSTLLLVGRSGHASTELAMLHAQTGLGDRVRFLGHRDDVPEILASADLFVFPSLYEGQGGALVEAMALGLPVVATGIPSTREVVEEGKNALLVPVESHQPLAKAISCLLDDPGRREAFGRRSREIFHERFTLDKSAARMVDLYRSLVAR